MTAETKAGSPEALRRFDVLACDVNMTAEPSTLSQMLGPLFPLMKKGGLLVVTLKLSYHTEQRKGSGRPGFRPWENRGVGLPLSAEQASMLQERAKDAKEKQQSPVYRGAVPDRWVGEAKLQKSVAQLLQQLEVSKCRHSRRCQSIHLI